MEENNNVKTPQKPVKVWKRKNIHLVNEENDIRFRGPLSYRHLRILGWFFLLIAQLGIVLGIASSAKLININGTFLTILKSANSLMTPLFLFAAFSQVLVAKDGYRKLLRTYILGAVGLFLLFTFVYLYFGVGLLKSMMGSWNEAFATAESFVKLFNSSGMLSFNIFIDLILCTLVTLFLNYRPTKYFQGNKIYIFRAFVAIPIIYELASIALKILASSGVAFVPPFVIPLLTTKPPVAFLIFIVCALFVKTREKRYIKHGKTHEEYKAFLNTNVNRLHFSSFLCFAILGAVVLDVILMVLIFAIKVGMLPENLEPDVLNAMITEAFQTTYNLGFGACLPMVLIIPVIIFFDYTKTYDDKFVDILIPVVGIVLLLIVYVIGLFEVLKGYLAELVKKGQSSEGDGEPIDGKINYLAQTIKGLFKK